MNPSNQVLEALRVILTVIGAESRPETAHAIALELASYPEGRVLAALARCKLECKYRLSLADVIERMEDGHVGPEEAWDLVPKSESETAVLTQEIMSSIPFDLLSSGDMTAARMAFRESYKTALAQARSERREPTWFASIGQDKRGREAPILRAVTLGRLSAPAAQLLLPAPEPTPEMALLTVGIGRV